MESDRVLIAGAGPVGLTLAIDLGRRGARCTLIERNPSTAPYPKMDRSNARKRRWCSMADCGNRNKAQKYYRREAGLI